MTVRDKASDLERTKRAQREAADPRASAWVSANAGTGKTHVLTQRALRLMLAGTIPERILCLTYTKAAAAEMSKRVYDTLAEWVTMAEEPLFKRLEELTAHAPTKEEIARARTLFTMAIETPGGLKVQTIHSFCERLLQRFPLEAGVAPGFSILDEATSHLLQREAIDQVLGLATREPSSPEGLALQTAIPFAADERFDELLREALRARRWLDAVTRMSDADNGDLAAVGALYRRALAVREDATDEDLTQALAEIICEPDLQRLRDALSGGGSNDRRLADKVATALAARAPALRVDALEAFFCTGKGEARASLMSKAIKTDHPDLDASLTSAQARFITLLDERKALAVVAATLALTRLAGAVLQRYGRAKARRAALDYDDLIAKTVSLLHEKQWADWVLFKLDRGIDHILVDEAQDTSREQWHVVKALAEEFFSGLGQREEARTVFAVGDEKQSIYSFQGAAPQMFEEMARRFAELTQDFGAPLKRIPLDLSFRTVAPILASVDRVFADPQRTPGITAEPTAIHHAVHRLGHGGLVEIWPTEAHDDGTPADAWSPLDEGVSSTPQVRLAERVADTIKDWLDSGERLTSEDRPVRPSDILVLVRKRRPFAGPMVAALKARKIPVAGADRLRLAEQIAVEDLVSLGQFLTLPEDDLALAEVLKSPLIALDDDDLLALAVGRKGTLWKALIDAAEAKPAWKAAADTLKRWRARADFAPPFEFFANILDREGARARFLARLGAEAADPLDEFLNLALAYDDQAPPSLTGFLAYLAEADREVKRDMEQGRDEVRVMTVHGAKGLEAPIVFLPDTCTTATAGNAALFDLAGMALPSGVEDKPFVWRLKGSGNVRAIAAARARRDELEAHERHRLLYVAMTRARDRLYVAGFEGKKGRAKGCWYEIIEEELSETLIEVGRADGTRVRRLSEAQSAPPQAPRHAIAGETIAAPLPAWAKSAVPREPGLTIPLAPSRLEAYAPDETGEPLPAQPFGRAHDEPTMPSPIAAAGESRFLRGTLTHALLQHLPMLPAAGWPSAAKGFVERRGAALSARVRSDIVKETLAILTDPAFAALFGPESRAEVPIVARLPNPKPQGAALKLIGQIDRVVDTGNDILIVDYKTNRPPPKKVEDVAKAYLFQLAAYRLALREIYPGRPLRAALLWIEAPRIMQLPGEILDEYAARLWELDLSVLDAS
ncbi:MAG TPA: double-strand break repair helicase AddA [Hyphomicrobium sp.]